LEVFRSPTTIKDTTIKKTTFLFDRIHVHIPSTSLSQCCIRLVTFIYMFKCKQKDNLNNCIVHQTDDESSSFFLNRNWGSVSLNHEIENLIFCRIKLRNQKNRRPSDANCTYWEAVSARDREGRRRGISSRID